jgi:hypothetical protein
MELLLKLPWMALEGMWMMTTLFFVFLYSSSLAWKLVALCPLVFLWWGLKTYGRDD